MVLGGGMAVMIRMPGESHTGTLPPLTAEQRELSQRLREHVVVLADEIGERNMYHLDALERAADYIAEELGALGYEVAVQEFAVGRDTACNLASELPGAAKADEIVVVGAHYDSVAGCPAANDNGSGVAALIELARMLCRDAPERTVRFVAFANEEPPHFQTGTMGSRHYARACRKRGERVV
ncbi:unnamed protein product, partial [marine sediment metagenome]